MFTATNRARININTEVREGLNAEGAIGEEDHTMDALLPMRFSAAERGDAKSYEEGDVIVAHQSVKTAGITKGHIYEVVAQTNTTLTLQRESHEDQIEITPTQGSKLVKSLEVYERTEREMSTGEAVKFRITDKSEDVTNGMRGTVKEITDTEVHVALEDGSVKTMDRDSLAVKGMDQAHALTAHDMQGASVRHPIMALSSGEHFANLKSFYVGVSRSVEDFELITNDAEKLQVRITEQTGEVPTALEAYIEGVKERGSMVHESRLNESEKDQSDDRKNHDKNTPDDTTEREAPALTDAREKEQDQGRSKTDEPVEAIEELKQKLADEMKQFDQRVRQEKTR